MTTTININLTNIQLPAKPVLNNETVSETPKEVFNKSEKTQMKNGAHMKEMIECWGFKGKLTCKDDGTEYSFGDNFLHVNLLPKFLRFIPPLTYHLSLLTDIYREKYHSTEMLEPMIPGLTKTMPGDKLHEKLTYFRPDQFKTFGKKAEIVEQNDASFVLTSTKRDGSNLNLKLTPLTNPLILGDNGTVQLGTNGYLKGYAYPQIKAEGTIENKGKTKKVEGTIFGEHFWGETNPLTTFKNLNWFEINLANSNTNQKTNLVIYDFRNNKDQQITPTANIMQNSGEKQETVHDVEVKVLEYWKSDKTWRKYPVKWEINIPSKDINLTASAVIPNQEATELGFLPVCWFGGLDVEGKINGQKIEGDAVSLNLTLPVYLK